MAVHIDLQKTVGRCRRHQRTAIDGRYQRRDQRTAIDGKAEKVSAESVRWEGKEEWATIVD